MNAGDANLKVELFFQKIGERYIYKYKYLIFLLIAIVLGLSMLGMSKMTVDSSNESFLDKNDPITKLNKRFKETFGNEEYVFILVESEDMFSYEALQLLRRIQDDIQKRLPFVDEVTSLENAEYMSWEDDTLYVDELIPGHIPANKDQLTEIREKALGKKDFDSLVTPDGKAAGIFISFEMLPEKVYCPVKKGFNPLDQAHWQDDEVILADKIFLTPSLPSGAGFSELNEVEDPRKLIAPALRVILKSHHAPGFTITPIGVPVLDYQSEVLSMEEMGRLGIFSIIAAVFFLIIFFRSFWGVVSPVMIAVFTLFITFGFMGFAGFPINMSSIVITNLVLVISVSYSVHFINHFREELSRTGSKLKALSYSYKTASWPCLLSALTTAAGFASFIFVPFKPIRQMGITCSIAIMVTYCLILLLLPSLFSFSWIIPPVRTGKSPAASQIEAFSESVYSRAKPLFFIFTLLIIVLAVLASRVGIEGDMIKMLGEKVGFVKDVRHVTDRLGSLYSYSILIELPEDDMVKEPAVMKGIDTITGELEKEKSVRKSISLANIVKEIRQVLNENNPAYYQVPRTRGEIAQYLLLYEMSGGDSMNSIVDFNFRTTHITVQLKETLSAGEIDRQFDRVKSMAVSMFPEGTKINIAGDMPVLMRVMDNIMTGQIMSVIIAFCIITIVMSIVLRSIKMGLLLMIPNVLPVFFVLGLMGTFGLNLNLLTMMVSSIVIGIAVDDTLHFGVHYGAEFIRLQDYRQANKRTFMILVKPFFFTAIVLVSGFGLLGASKMAAYKEYAVCAGTAILAALAADLLLTPALIKIFKPYGREKNKKSPVYSRGFTNAENLE